MRSFRTSLLDHPGLLIFGVALAARLAWVLTLDNALSWPDEREFVDIARHLANGDGYVSTSYRANPVFPAYLALIFSVAGENYLAARIGQAILGALTCFFIYRTASLAINRRAGVLSGALAALYLPHIFLSGVFYVECLFTFAASASVYLGVRTTRRQLTLRDGVTCGIACGTTILTRPIFAAYIPFLCAAWIYVTWPRWRKQVVLCIALVVASASVVLPWTIRNYVVYKRFIPVTTGFYTTLWQGNNPLAVGDANDRLLFWPNSLFWDNPYWASRLERLAGQERQEVEAQYARADRLIRGSVQGQDWYLAADPVLKPIAIRYILSNPGRTIALFFRKIGTLFSALTPMGTANKYTSSRNRILAALAFYPMLTLAILGTFLGIRETRSLSVVYAFVVSMAGAYAALTACTRFRLPLDPYLIVFSSLALVRIGQAFARLAQRSGPRTVPAQARWQQAAAHSEQTEERPGIRSGRYGESTNLQSTPAPARRCARV